MHAEASEVAEGLRRLHVEDRRSVEEKLELEGVVKAVKEGMAEAAGSIERNWEDLEGRMRSLQERIQAMH